MSLTRLTLRFEADAVEALVDAALAQGLAVRDLCARLFKDFQFGLKLVSQNTGQTEFPVTREVVSAPDRFLSEWIVASYRATEKNPAL